MRRYHYYESDWENAKPNWYEFVKTCDDELNSCNLSTDIIKWLYQSIDMPYRHCRWNTNNKTIIIRFRYERDYILCTLRWG